MDFNGDGKIDLLVVAPYFTSEASVYLNRGDGTFGAPVTTTVSVMFPFNSISAFTGDINGDGRKDLLAVGTSFLGSMILSLLAQSDGRLATPIVTALTQQIGSAQLRDVNGDYVSDYRRLHINPCRSESHVFRSQHRSAIQENRSRLHSG